MSDPSDTIARPPTAPVALKGAMKSASFKLIFEHSSLAARMCHVETEQDRPGDRVRGMVRDSVKTSCMAKGGESEHTHKGVLAMLGAHPNRCA